MSVSSTQWTGETSSAVTTSYFTAAPNDRVGTQMGKDKHYFDFTVRQYNTTGVIPAYTTSDPTNGKIDKDLAREAMTALALVLRSKLNAGELSNFEKITRIRCEVDMH